MFYNRFVISRPEADLKIKLAHMPVFKTVINLSPSQVTIQFTQRTTWPGFAKDWVAAECAAFPNALKDLYVVAVFMVDVRFNWSHPQVLALFCNRMPRHQPDAGSKEFSLVLLREIEVILLMICVTPQTNLTPRLEERSQ